MKITKLCVLLFSMVVFVSCKKEEQQPTKDTTVETNTVEKQTVIVKDTVKAVTPAEPKGTSVKVDDTGVKVESKAVNVEVKK
ncbi:MAG: hypothetical protein H7239_03920 [Flavobacterium sp.]|nr:hypothetical protein [Flavobacterium sp.]